MSHPIPARSFIEIDVAPGRKQRLPLAENPIPIAPLKGFTGQMLPKPWHHKVSICLPHLDTLEQLALALELWRCQTLPPYFLVIDTGSPAELLQDLEKLRYSDCELHYIRAHGYLHSSAPVTTALDLAHSLCRTEYLFMTHTDVFPRQRHFLHWLMQQCNEAQPVVGWQMSERGPGGSASSNEWRECVSHTATMLHMPTVHKHRLTWAMEAYYAQRPQERGNTVGWPDTESPFLLSMRAAGIKPVLLGTEPNYTRHVTDWFDHARSFTGLKATAKSGGLSENLLYARAIGYMADAEKEARQRLLTWQQAQGAMTPAAVGS